MSLVCTTALALTLFTATAFAQDAPHYPNRPIRLIVPFAPGGGLDISARLIGHKLTEKWGHNVVVDSRPGAATIVGTEIASKAAPDGHTVLMITTTFAINPGLYAKLPYDPGKDFVPVTQLNSQPNVVVVAPNFAGKSVKDLIAAAKAKPGELTFASPGAGSAPHLAAEMFQRAAGVSLIHVPYKGIPAAVTDVIGGRITMLFTTTISAAPHIKSGKLRAVAITSAKRQPSMPDLPTVGETLPGFDLGEVPLTGGGSDGNFTAAFGVPTLDGLGAEGDGAHTLHEHIVVSTLPLRLQFLHGLLRDLAWDSALT